MGIRIDQIRVNRGGPLAEDFELTPAKLNLIYGQNETGKTYLIEAILRLLFTQGRKGDFDWKLRNWDTNGRILVSGIEEGPTTFGASGKKLDQLLRDTREGLSPGLSQLLVVKAGDAMLNREQPDGVGDGFLKNHLSGEGLIDSIARGISQTLIDAEVTVGIIQGANRGEIKKRSESKRKLLDIDDLLHRIDSSQELAAVESLEEDAENLKAKLKDLEQAKRFRAGAVHRQLLGLSAELKKLPTKDEVQALQHKVDEYSSRLAEKTGKEKELSELEPKAQACDWAENAESHYSSLIGEGPKTGAGNIYLWLALASFILTVALGAMGQTTLLLFSGVGVLAFGSLHVHANRKAMKTAGKNAELERLQNEYQDRFGEELTNQAALKARVDVLRKDRARAELLQEGIGNLSDKLHRSRIEIRFSFGNMGAGGELEPTDWAGALTSLRQDLHNTLTKIELLRRDWDRLNVDESQFVEEDPGTPWDATSQADLESKLDETQRGISEAQESLNGLRGRIQQEVKTTLSSWSSLVVALQEARAAALGQYRAQTADILAKIALNNALDESRTQETQRIAEGLRREEITTSLKAVGGHYTSLQRGGDGEDQELIVVSRRDDQVHLGDLSTGAQEQVFFALRLGFASVALGGEPAFLILDDAFQHSDWNRREELVSTVHGLTDHGWQIFYFTMDNHLRDLFKGAGERDQTAFKYHELTG